MSDSPEAPTESTASFLVSPPHPPSDSAPPPSSSSVPASLPPRTYSQQPVFVQPPPAYAPNSSVPKFIRLLATLLFLGGTITAGAAWFYKRIVYPRLVLALKARIQLFSHHESKYSHLFDTLLDYTRSTSCARLGGTEAIEFVKEDRGKREVGEVNREGQESEKKAQDGEQQPLLDNKGGEEEGTAQESNEDDSIKLPPPPQLLAPLQESLSSLHSTIALATNPRFTSLSNPSNLVQPQGQLMRSLVTFNEYLESESYSVSSSTSSSRAYGSTSVSGSGAVTGERKALVEATSGFKAEIRSIKGALLNRRNFVRPEVATTA